VSGTVTQNLRLPGQYFDAESGWSHNGFRNYLPDLGRYAEPDPLAMQGGTRSFDSKENGANLYIYAQNNPILLRDPFGFCPKPKCSDLSLNNPSAFWDDNFATPEQIDSFFETTNSPASWDGAAAAAAFIAQGINPGLAVGIIGGETSFGNNGLSTRNTMDPFSSGGSSFQSSLARGLGTIVKLENHTYTDDTPVSGLFNGQNDLPSNIPGSGQVYSTTDGDKYPWVYRLLVP
jgi:RHS repeat-associated protein